MLTPSAERLLDALRNDERVQSRFDIQDYFGANECGTTGCIAGWCVLLDAQVTPDISIDTYHSRLETPHSVVSAFDYSKDALGLTEGQARHLFITWGWRCDWNTLSNGVFSLWTPNSTPDYTTQRRLQEFAREWVDFNFVTARQAAHALENVLLNHPGWVDWHRAVEAEPA